MCVYLFSKSQKILINERHLRVRILRTLVKEMFNHVIRYDYEIHNEIKFCVWLIKISLFYNDTRNRP